MPPIITTSKESLLTVVEGTSLDLNCTATGFPTPKVCTVQYTVHCTAHHLTQPAGLASLTAEQAACRYMVMLPVPRWRVKSTLKEVYYFAHL